eukprot:6183919-Pleurochrysis_carterae.AAC.2
MNDIHTADVLTDPNGYYRFSWAAPTDQCGTSPNTDFDGIASFSRGFGDKGFKRKTAGECCKACLDNTKCNTWVFCGEPLCFAPDIWNHSFGECWLKGSPGSPVVQPLVNMRGEYTEKYRRRHPTAPKFVQWTAGIVRTARHVNGTWSTRAGW